MSALHGTGEGGPCTDVAPGLSPDGGALPHRPPARAGAAPTRRRGRGTRPLATAVAGATSGPGFGGRALLSVAVRAAGALSSPSR